jgi:hypothetical protein
MTSSLWIAMLLQMAMGAFDTLYHHEGTERLAWRPSQALELRLHGVRNLAYALLFAALGWTIPQGLWAAALLALLAGELLITLWDFVEEDRTRHLPASERVTHTLLTLNYGVILALLVPQLVEWAGAPTSLGRADHGLLSWLCALAAFGVVISGVRDLAAARRCPRLEASDPAELAAALAPGMAVLVTGGTGFVGSRLVGALAAAGHEVTVLTRRRTAGGKLIPRGHVRLVEHLDEIASAERFGAVVNLAGEPIANTPWTRAKRLRIVRSRLAVTYALLRLIRRLDHKPAVLVSGSAVGFYGLRGDQPLTEVNLGSPCFSRRVCVGWERAAWKADGRGRPDGAAPHRPGAGSFRRHAGAHAGAVRVRRRRPLRQRATLDELDPPRRSRPAHRPLHRLAGASRPGQRHRAGARHQSSLRRGARSGARPAGARADPRLAVAACARRVRRRAAAERTACLSGGGREQRLQVPLSRPLRSACGDQRRSCAR